MKKTIGIILLVIAGLNFFALIVRGSQGESIGSPFYLIILVMMAFGGFSLIKNAKKKDESDTDIQKSE